MKKICILFIACSMLLGVGCVNQVNVGKTVGAASDLGSAASISDAELQQMSQAMRAQGDKQNRVASAGNKYAKRLAKLTAKHTMEKGQPLNYKVYITSDVNANASADGSIRVYSGLMDMMTDAELMYVLGHEIGHVINQDSLSAMRMAYTTSAVRKGAGALNSTADALTNTQLAALLESAINAQFSQKQELGADAYSLEFLKKNGYDAKAAVTALRKLETLSAGGGGLLASHPDPGDRARRIENALNK